MDPLTHGIRANLRQFVFQLLQVFCVGLTLGMMRTVVPAVAESEYGVPRGNVGIIVVFVIAFGIVKGVMNFVAGRISESLGRKRVLVIGWAIALPIPFMIRYGLTWNWIVAATVLLGINQGLTWSMALTSKLDLTRPEQRGMTNGLNEFFGYLAVAIAGAVTPYLAQQFGPRAGLFIFGLAVIIPALAMAMIVVRETKGWADSEGLELDNKTRAPSDQTAKYMASTPGRPLSLSSAQPLTVSPPRRLTVSVLSLTWRNRTFFAICQAGMVEKFTDALIWVILPVYLVSRGIELQNIGWIPFIYGTIWGVSQLVTGPLSDRIGRKIPITAGMFLCAIGVALMPLRQDSIWWGGSAAIAGLGMALLYPTLGAAVSDIAHPTWRGSALGVYRFWRDLGYGVGALGLGLVAHYGGRFDLAFFFVALCTALSGILMWLLAEETRPTHFKQIVVE